MVGTACRMTMRTMVSMPLRPRSSTRVRPPVLRSRWKRSDSWCMCSKVLEREPAHRVHRHLGEHAVAQLRQHRHQDAHAAIGERHRDRRGDRPGQPASRRATGALPCPASASVAHLKVNGTAMVASLATTSSSGRQQHALLAGRAGRTARYRATAARSVANSAPPSAETSRFIACGDRVMGVASSQGPVSWRAA